MKILVKKSITHDTIKVLDNNKQADRTLLLKIKKFQSKRAVSDIIVTLLLVAITVVTGIIMYGIIKDTGISETVTAGISKPLTFEGGIKISAYDARDGSNLMGIGAVDNSATTDGKLKSSEHIVLNITNNSPNLIFLNDIIVNEVSHTFDTSLPPSSSGKFSIIPFKSTGVTDSSPGINGSRTVTVVVKLGSISDISINDAIRVKINAIGFDLQNFIITAGHAR